MTAAPANDTVIEEELSLIDEARVLVQAEEYASAKELLLRALEETDHDGEACILLCDVTRELKQFEESADYGLKATQLLPESPEAHLAYAESIGAQLVQPDDGIGAILNKLAMLDRFQQECVRAVELDDSLIEPRMMLGFFYLAMPEMVGGDSEKAMRYFREVEERDPAMGGHLVAFCLAETGHVEESLDLCAARLDEWPEQRGYHVTRAIILERNEQYAEADLAYEAARPAGGERDEAYFRSLHAQASGLIEREIELERAIALLSEFLANERPRADGMPTIEDAYWRQGQALELLGKQKEALVAYQAALEAEPTHRESLAAIKSLSAADPSVR